MDNNPAQLSTQSLPWELLEDDNINFDNIYKQYQQLEIKINERLRKIKLRKAALKMET